GETLLRSIQGAVSVCVCEHVCVCVCSMCVFKGSHICFLMDSLMGVKIITCSLTTSANKKVFAVDVRVAVWVWLCLCVCVCVLQGGSVYVCLRVRQRERERERER